MIPFAKPTYFGKEESYVLEALKSTWISDGPFVTSFEETLEQELNIQHVLTTSNGTSALHLAYLSLGINPYDVPHPYYTNIIVPGFGFQAAANIARLVGANPVFVDVDPDTWLVTEDNIRNSNLPAKTVVVTHTYGNVVTLSDNFYREYDVIEDCAEAMFSKYRNKSVGTFGIIGTFSFHATKTITTGEGGAISTNLKDIYDKALLIRSHGLRKRGSYDHEVIGHNFRMTNIQAALGESQLYYKESIIEKKKLIYEWYKERLSEFVFQKVNPDVSPVFWAVALKVENRDKLINYLRSKEIETRPGFTSPTKLKQYLEVNLPVSDELEKTVIVLPTFTSITEDEVDFICENVRSKAWR
jgi:perosamine synthetase